MARKFMFPAKVKCQYCDKVIEDDSYFTHMTSCTEKEKHIKKLLKQMGELPY